MGKGLDNGASLRDRAGGPALIPSAELDKPFSLTIVNWEGRIHCAYLNDFRIAGGKPWGGGSTAKEWKGITLRELARAIPALRDALGLDYLGRPLARDSDASLAEDPKGLSGEAVAARAEGIAQPSPEASS